MEPSGSINLVIKFLLSNSLRPELSNFEIFLLFKINYHEEIPGKFCTPTI